MRQLNRIVIRCFIWPVIPDIRYLSNPRIRIVRNVRESIFILVLIETHNMETITIIVITSFLFLTWVIILFALSIRVKQMENEEIDVSQV